MRNPNLCPILSNNYFEGVSMGGSNIAPDFVQSDLFFMYLASNQMSRLSSCSQWDAEGPSSDNTTARNRLDVLAFLIQWNYFKDASSTNGNARSRNFNQYEVFSDYLLVYKIARTWISLSSTFLLYLYF